MPSEIHAGWEVSPKDGREQAKSAIAAKIQEREQAWGHVASEITESRDYLTKQLDCEHLVPHVRSELQEALYWVNQIYETLPELAQLRKERS